MFVYFAPFSFSEVPTFQEETKALFGNLMDEGVYFSFSPLFIYSYSAYTSVSSRLFNRICPHSFCSPSYGVSCFLFWEFGALNLLHLDST